jgi:methyl-accepting chemotaxis protein
MTMSMPEIIPTGTTFPKRPSRLFGIKIIKPQFQFKFASVVFIFMALSTGLIWFWGNFTISRLMESGLVRGDEALQSLAVIKGNIAYISFVSMAVVYGLSLLYSYYLAGPIYRFEKIFEEMRGGNLNLSIKLRKHDEFQDSALLLSQALSSLRNKLSHEREEINSTFEKLKKISESLKQSGQNAEANQIEQLIIEFKKFPVTIKLS